MSIERDSAIIAIDGSVVVIVIVAAGALVTRYGVSFTQFLDNHGSESLSKVILNLLLPALLFTEMIKSLDISKLGQFGMLFFFCTFHTFAGYLVGWILAKMTKASANVGKLIMACVAFQDTTAIPLIFAQVLGNSDVTNSDSDFKTDAINYVLIYTVFVTVYKWSVAYKMLIPIKNKVLDSSAYETSPPINSSLADSQSFKSSVLSYEPIVPVKKGWVKTIKKIMNPPIYATIASIPLGLIPYMKEYVFCGSGAVFTNNLFAALTTMGATVSPLICILLGNKLSHGYPPSADISNLHILVTLIGKEVIMPLLGLFLSLTFYNLGIINRVLTICVMIIYAAPTSLQLLMICTAHKNQVDNVSKIYLIMYGTAAIPMAAWTMGFLIILY